MIRSFDYFLFFLFFEDIVILVQTFGPRILDETVESLLQRQTRELAAANGYQTPLRIKNALPIRATRAIVDPKVNSTVYNVGPALLRQDLLTFSHS